MNHIQPQPSACSFSSDIRNQRSLKHILDFTRATPAPTPDEIRESILLYMHILHDCQTANIPLYPPTLIPTPGGVISEQTRPVAHLYSLFRCLYEYSPTPAGRTNIVQTVLHALFPARPNRLGYTHPATRALSAILHRARCWFNFTLDGKQRIYSKLQAIADDLLRGFFVQFKAQGGRTPSVSALITPRSCYEVCLEQGTTGRSKNLRQLCLQRDDNRCIITRNMDACYAEAQIELAELNGTELPDEMGVHTEVVHIIPHALNELGPDGTLGESKAFAWRIMDMLDPGITQHLEGAKIDLPSNALTLCIELRKRFGDLKWYFDPVPDTPHTYIFRTVRNRPIHANYTPKSPTIVFAAAGSIPPPDPRLLQMHRACCLILSMSGTGAAVERVLRDAEELAGEPGLACDGSSNFMAFWSLRQAFGGSGAASKQGFWFF